MDIVVRDSSSGDDIVIPGARPDWTILTLKRNITYTHPRKPVCLNNCGLVTLLKCLLFVFVT